MKHTPAPWRHVLGHDTHAVKRDRHGRMLGSVELSLEDYDHAIECVNALSGLNPSAVEGMVQFIKRVVADSGATVRKGANGEPELCGGLDPAILLDEFYRHARAALARAEGGAK